MSRLARREAMGYLNASAEDLARSDKLHRAIAERIGESPGGVITFGEFVGFSMYGCGDVPGYYTHDGFAPNDFTNDKNSFGTMAKDPGFGGAIGEIIAIESMAYLGDNPLEIIEVGGGDGTAMTNIIAGALRQLRGTGHQNGVGVTLIDRAGQLLDRQQNAIQSMTTTERPLQVHALPADIQNITGPIKAAGAVVSNELLDMLPFEVAFRSDSVKPKILYVGCNGGELAVTVAPAPDEYQDQAAATLRQNPNAQLKSFQPNLLRVMQNLASLVVKGTIITADYKAGDDLDVQVVRIGARSDIPLIEVDYPGLFDISVTPDWRAVIAWARATHGDSSVAPAKLGDFLLSAPSYNNVWDLLPESLRFNAARTPHIPYEDLLKANLDNYDALLIRK